MDKITFWDAKIRGWEKKRYRAMTNSVAYRMAWAARFLNSKLHGLSVLELGCGSGILASHLLRSGLSSYVGLDFSASAIQSANTRLLNSANSQKFQFTCVDLTKIDLPRADVVVSLGLFDWLDDHEIVKIFNSTSGAKFLHSFSSSEVNVISLLHRVMVHVQYGYRNRGYCPRYRSNSNFQLLVPDQTVKFVKEKRLSFGRFLHNWESNAEIN